MTNQKNPANVLNSDNNESKKKDFDSNLDNEISKILSNDVFINNSERINYINTKIKSGNLSSWEIAYYNRILRVLSMPDLSKKEWHPINLTINKILSSQFFNWFDYVKVPEIVSEFETFDLFNFSENHVARRPSDSYFINKSTNKKNSMLLRPHTSVMWYHYLLNWWGKEKLENNGEVKGLSRWKVYRVDNLDKTHHECFHQIDWLRITEKDKEIITQDTLKEVLWNTIKALFGENAKYRFNEDSFPYTTDSLEVEVEYEWKWLEVLGAWVVHPTVLEKLWLDPNKYNWRAFGFWLDRLVMALKKVPDIRIFWSEDPRITSQRWNLNPYKEVSVYPPVLKDISFITSKIKFVEDKKEMEKSWKMELINEADLFDIAGIARDISWWLIEEIKVIDIFENDKKFWNDKKSVCIRISFRSLERTLTNDEINIVYFNIRDKIEKELWYKLR